MAPVTRALIPKGFQSVKLGLTEGLVGGAIKAAVSRALNWPDPTRLLVITFDIERPRELTSPNLSVKSAIAIGRGSTWPEFMSISKSFALDTLIKRKRYIDITNLKI